MSESSILKTTQTILNRIELEEQLKIKNRAVGHASILFDGIEKPFWLMRLAALGNYNIIRDLVGNPVTVEPIPNQELKIGGQNVFRDSKMGAFIIQNGLGRHAYNPNGKAIDTVINLKSYYNPTVFNGEPDGIQGMIEELGSTSYSFSSIRALIEEIKGLKVTKEHLEEEIERYKEFSDKVEQLKQELSETERAIVEKQQALKKHMSYEIQLRERAILDKYQDSIKRSKVLNGALVINGGPGTGKTTMLIQRITYLTSPTIEEVIQLSEEDRSILYNKDRSWIFFSPSELLRSYLDYAMRKEGLSSDKEKVTTWELFKQRAAREYGLINADTRRPFVYLKGRSFYKSDINALHNLLDSFNEYYLQYQQNKCKRSYEVNTSSFEWHSLALRIKASLKDMFLIKDLRSFIAAYFNLKESFYADTQKVKTTYVKALTDFSNRLQIIVENDNEIHLWFKNELLATGSSSSLQEDEDDLEVEADLEVFEEDEAGTEDLRLKLSKTLRRIIRKYALSKVDQNTSLSKSDKKFVDQLEKYLDEENLKPIAGGAFFLKYFEKISRGVEINMLREFSLVYKAFRKEKNADIKPFLTLEGIKILEDTLNAKSERNRKATTSEFDFFFYWINSLVKELYKTNTLLYQTSTDKYIVGFRNLYKGVVAIDEATDFTALELISMSTFAYPKFNSVTLSGDLMQRMTANGIQSWDDYTSLSGNVEVASLKIAYRQTPKLLKLASLIYEKNTGTKPDFRSYALEDNKYPEPLYFVNDDDEQRIQWIADRVTEINKVYGDAIPSIALFVKDDAEVTKVAQMLNNNNSITELFISAIPCIGGQILGDKQNIRVFPIQHIKGLEFEAVFFWDIDTIGTVEYDLLDKYIYVGLSRATFYLGITAVNGFPEELMYLKESLSDTGKWL